jgi:siroheme synthase-like protein
MRTHAVFLRLEGRRCVVVGGDAAAERKVEGCLAAGALVIVVAEQMTPALERLGDAGRVTLERRTYREGDLHGAVVAYASVRERDVIGALRAEADREQVLLNVLDVPDACDFYAPAVVARGDLQIAIGTGGSSPRVASRLRRDLEARIGPEYAPYLAILGAVRRTLAGARRSEVLDRLLDSDLLRLVRNGEGDEVDALLSRLAGEECTLRRLGVTLGGEG